MPGKRCAQRRPFGLGLLHAVLAEQAMAGFEHGQDVLGVEGLGDGDEVDGRRIAPGRLRGGCDAGAATEARLAGEVVMSLPSSRRFGRSAGAIRG